MKETNCWQQFLNTGKVSDYLSYVDEKRTRQMEEKGAHPNAGTDQCYRNDIESGTFRGI